MLIFRYKIEITKMHFVYRFRVVSYNILADLYACSTTGKEELFSYCAPYALALDYRKQLLFKELMG